MLEKFCAALWSKAPILPVGGWLFSPRRLIRQFCLKTSPNVGDTRLASGTNVECHQLLSHQLLSSRKRLKFTSKMKPAGQTNSTPIYKLENQRRQLRSTCAITQMESQNNLTTVSETHCYLATFCSKFTGGGIFRSEMQRRNSPSQNSMISSILMVVF